MNLQNVSLFQKNVWDQLRVNLNIEFVDEKDKGIVIS